MAHLHPGFQCYRLFRWDWRKRGKKAARILLFGKTGKIWEQTLLRNCHWLTRCTAYFHFGNVALLPPIITSQQSSVGRSCPLVLSLSSPREHLRLQKSLMALNPGWQTLPCLYLQVDIGCSSQALLLDWEKWNSHFRACSRSGTALQPLNSCRRLHPSLTSNSMRSPAALTWLLLLILHLTTGASDAL